MDPWVSVVDDIRLNWDSAVLMNGKMSSFLC
jgi:hypothetical protein